MKSSRQSSDTDITRPELFRFSARGAAVLATGAVIAGMGCGRDRKRLSFAIEWPIKDEP
jgi:hypothetical protein